MERVYLDKDDNIMTKKEVQLLPPEQLQKRSGVPVNILSTTDAIYESIADIMIETVLSKKGGKVTMILPVGPVGQYPVFTRKVKEKKVNCQNLWTFNMDEFLDRNGRTIPESHPMSFKGEMMKNFFNLIPAELRMPISQMFFPRHDNMEEINSTFDKHASEGVDLCLAGVGPEGHFAFNEDPNFRHVEVSEEEFLTDRTRLVLVNTSTVDMDALVASCGDRSDVPPFAVTIGPRDVLMAKRTEVIFFAGKFQRTALRETLFRKPTMRFPGSLLKLRRKKDGSLEPQNLTIWATPQEAGMVTSQTI
ncbi:MAG: 6-phosphogluconolactonase [Planctomycetes bacterium]|nr:6-phosphogluconolactonase [Planctomycetota bacterium]